ncbi:Leucine-rich repeat-containing protein 51 [Phytophthora citrophthora]|uniref:Leucine-rich repeat-containing protein 51 n=1 Tax=Phytophthora citrophthora TaxID=4793 RepID=A0AAD9GQT0_9STRA|nr:Leucine-rich repeat-containing protein 51 [Phytophthora citrophthora]
MVEAIAVTNTRAVEMTTATGHTTHGLQKTGALCGVAMSSEGFPFLVLFRQMEPDAAYGSINVDLETDLQDESIWRLEHLDLPNNITQFRILLFSSTVNTGGAECKAIEALCGLGVQEDHITLVFILCSTDSLTTICNRFPRVRIITGAIDNEIDPQTQEIIPGLGDFIAMDNGDNIVLLQAVAGVARTVRSLYGPNKLRKQVADELEQTIFTADAYTVLSTLQSQNAGTAVLQQALDQQHKVFGTTANHMRMASSETIPSFQELMWSRKVGALGEILSVGSIATALAVKVASTLDPIEFCGDDVSLQDLVTMHTVLGGATSATSSQVLDGVLLPISDASLDTLRHIFSSTTDNTIVVDGGVVVVAGDLGMADFSMEISVQIIFVNGEIDPKMVDASASNPKAPLCIPVSSYNSLRLIAEMSGAEIIESWDEILPNAIGHENLQLKALELSASRTQEDEENDFATFFVRAVLSGVRCQPHASVVVQGPTKSLAVELRNETFKTICRLRNTLRSNYLLPGNGGFWCACAAAVALETTSNQELLSVVTTKLAEPLLQLGVILLENSGASNDNDSYFSRLAQVQMVKKRFARSVEDVGADKFYSRYYDYRSAEYAVLPPKVVEPECEDGRISYTIEYKSTCAAIRGSFRVIQLLLNIDRHQVTMSSPAASPKKSGMPRRQAALVPLDYSFMGLTTLSEMQQHDPVGGTKKPIPVVSLTTRSSGDELTSPKSVDTLSSPKKRQVPVSLRVNNNKISHLNDMQGALRAVFDYPGMLQWLDISGNELESIPPDVFSAYPDLFTLHLHGNSLSKYSDIDALAKCLPRLHSITLHGNPIEEKKHYRNYAIAAFPNLKQLNFSSVTPGDRDKAETWARIYKNARNGGKSREEDL